MADAAEAERVRQETEEAERVKQDAEAAAAREMADAAEAERVRPAGDDGGKTPAHGTDTAAVTSSQFTMPV